MGGCLNSLPSTPLHRRLDPSLHEPINVIVTSLSWIEALQSEYGIWDQETPELKKEDIWLWMHYHRSMPNELCIDLENLNFRKWGKGDIFYTAKIPLDKLENSQFYHKKIGHNSERFHSLPNCLDSFGKRYIDYPDDHYFLLEKMKLPAESNFILGERKYLTKWRLCRHCEIVDGTLDRGRVAIFNKQSKFNSVRLDIIAFGTYAINYYDYEEKSIALTDPKGHVVQEKDETYHSSIQHNFIDRIEYRIMVNQLHWMSWFIHGDSRADYHTSSEVTFETPFFSARMEKGWLTKSKYYISTKAPYDPALSLLIAHLCCVEYSIHELKKMAGIEPVHWLPETTFPQHIIFGIEKSSLDLNIPASNGEFVIFV